MIVYLAYFQGHEEFGDADTVLVSPFSTYQAARAQADAWNVHYRARNTRCCWVDVLTAELDRPLEITADEEDEAK